jgi:CDP-diacylglycerol--serine O-phosphatidyltransferase
MYTSKYRYLIPNSVTFASLACGISSILAAASGNLRLAAALILISYVLDLFDGGLARRLNASSEFGMQLDSLVDMVSLGVAPAVLVAQHLRATNDAPLWVWPIIVLFPLAGAFRLARFNLLPEKEGATDSVGLTISTGGATPALAVLSDLAFPPFTDISPVYFFAALLLGLGLLMVSTIAFPPFVWLFKRRAIAFALLASAGVSIVAIGFFNAWFLFTGGYLGVSLARAGIYRKY